MYIFYRLQQQALRFASYFLSWRTPTIFKGENVYTDIVDVLEKDKAVLIVSGKNTIKLGLMTKLLSALNHASCKYVLYSKVLPNPTISVVEEALKLYHEKECYQIIAFGGGSPMDCAKILAARIAKPNQSISKMKGLLKVRKKLVPIIAIPTTAGSGSETTIAAVIKDDEHNYKYAISDPCLIPSYVAFIPELTETLPPLTTATTGLDALTHAIESYIGKSNTKQTKKDALEAIKLIHDNLLHAYNNINDTNSRELMLYAAFLAGKAFTRAFVGNVHAIAHAIGGCYNTAHGLANAVVLPVVLREYGEKIDDELAIISDTIGLCEVQASKQEKSQEVISWIEALNTRMGIPTTISDIQESDIPLMASRCYKEANPFYPVPVIFSVEKFEQILRSLKK